MIEKITDIMKQVGPIKKSINVRIMQIQILEVKRVETMELSVDLVVAGKPWT